MLTADMIAELAILGFGTALMITVPVFLVGAAYHIVRIFK